MGSLSDLLLEFIEALKATSGTNNKKALLKKHLVEESSGIRITYFCNYIRFVCDPRINLYKELNDTLKQPLRGFTRPVEFESDPNDVLAVIMELLYHPVEMRRGQAGDRLFQSAYRHLNEKYHPLLDLFVLRSLKAGVGAKTINQAVGEPKLIPEFGYQRCKTGTKEAVQKIIDECGEALCQRKEDGMFLNVYTSDGRCLTREGKELISKSIEGLQQQAKQLDVKDKVLCGECLVFDLVESKFLSRAKGNGMLNSIIQTGEDIDDRFEVVFIVWDMVPEEVIVAARNRKETVKDPKGQSAYLYRLATLKTAVENLIHSLKQDENDHPASFIRCISTDTISTVDEFREAFKENLQDGFEGVVIKRPDFYWYDGTASEMLKFKAEIEDDFRLVELLPGDPNGKYADTIGSVRFQSRDGLIDFQCAGITDTQRAHMKKSPDDWVDKIFAVRFNEICESESKPGVYSVTFPRIISEPRLDKTEASSYPEVLETIEKYFESI